MKNNTWKDEGSSLSQDLKKFRSWVKGQHAVVKEFQNLSGNGETIQCLGLTSYI